MLPAWLSTNLPYSDSINATAERSNHMLQVRQAFTADLSKGHHLVVADYGQLELRLLAHMTECKSMLEAFRAGGDFHSRTALGMYDHIKEAIAKGETTSLKTCLQASLQAFC